VKTLIQDLAIATCVIPTLAPHHPLQLVAIWVAAALTLATGVQYLNDGWRGTQKQVA
jgi:phosphatidylglycerophosphate synthase